MKEKVQTGEGRFDENYLTPFEKVLLGGSEGVMINNQKILINSSNLWQMMQSPDGRRIILSPSNATRGELTSGEAVKAREDMEFSTLIITLFEFEPWSKYLKQKIRFSLKPGELNDVGELSEFKLYPTQNGQRIDLSQIAPEDLILSKDFSKIVNFLGRENNALKFKIKSEEEMKKNKYMR